MANIRDYLKRKAKREGDKNSVPRISYREKIKSHKFTIFYRTILVIILIAAIAASKCLCGNGFGSVNNNCGCNN